MAWGFRTGSFATSGSVAAFPGTTAAGAAAVSGDRIVVGVLTQRTGGTPTTPTVTDNINAGNYTEDVFATGTNGTTQERGSIYSLANSGAGTPSVTVTSASSKGGFNITLYSGLLTTDPGSDVATGRSQASTTPSSGTTGVTSAGNELVFGGLVDDGENNTLGANAAYTSRGKHDVDTNQFQGLSEDQDSGASGGTESAAFTCNTIPTIQYALCVVYKLAGAAATLPPGGGESGVGTGDSATQAAMMR